MVPDVVSAGRSVKSSTMVVVDVKEGIAKMREKSFRFYPHPSNLMEIFGKGGLVNALVWEKSKYKIPKTKYGVQH
jgi:hypothetical protein